MKVFVFEPEVIHDEWDDRLEEYRGPQGVVRLGRVEVFRASISFQDDEDDVMEFFAEKLKDALS